MIQNLVTIAFLVFLEGMLSFDNALVLAVLARHLPEDQRKKALTYGMWGAVGFRLLALTLLTYIVQSIWIKFAGGIYLLYLALRHFGFHESSQEPEGTNRAFWKTILLVELTDIAFSSDSILASVAVSDQLWVVFTGGVLGIVMMRLAAMLFIKLIARFPNLENTAYFLVTVVGFKLVIESARIPEIDFHSTSNPAYWVLWGTMALCVAAGFIPTAKSAETSS